MITYEPLWKTMKLKKISTYKLIHEYNISSGTIHQLRCNKCTTTQTINDLCNILQCDVSDILKFVPDKDPYRKVEHREFDF